MHQSTQQLRLLNTPQAAAILGISPNTLKLWRHKKRGPAFIKLGDSPQSGVAYDEADVRAFIESRRFDSTSGYSPAAQANVRSTVRRPDQVSR